VDALVLMVTFIVLLPEPPGIVAGLNVALASVGKPLTLKSTLLVKPATGVDVTV
jgi:hypothetical protein